MTQNADSLVRKDLKRPAPLLEDVQRMEHGVGRTLFVQVQEVRLLDIIKIPKILMIVREF